MDALDGVAVIAFPDAAGHLFLDVDGHRRHREVLGQVLGILALPHELLSIPPLDGHLI